MKLDGIHHITAITADAPRNVDFYTRLFGLRLAAKTVNQDDPTAYHLFYADENARPGSELTFFEYPEAPRGRHGAGMVHAIVWRLGSASAVDFWASRLTEGGVAVNRVGDLLVFEDFEGIGHEFCVTDAGDEPMRARHPDIPDEFALQGFEGVRAYAADVSPSGALIEQVMGGSSLGGGKYELRGDKRGSWIEYESPPPEPGEQGAGTVHHVAWGTTQEEHPRWVSHLQQAGVQSTPVIDRHYFHSIYFREPSGVLFEIADDGPGFTVDVPLEQLGSKVILPPKYEPFRDQIEKGLTPLTDPRAGWDKTSE